MSPDARRIETAASIFTNGMEPPSGVRYRQLGRQRLGNGKLLKPRESSKNAQSPGRPLHPLLGAHLERQPF